MTSFFDQVYVQVPVDSSVGTWWPT